jgi:large subunit ribosomal protein L30
MITVIVRIRGQIGVKKQIKDTLKMLRIPKNHNCNLIPETPIYKGMVHKVKDYIAYGPISDNVLKQLLKARLVRKDKKKVDDALVTKVIKTLKDKKLLKDVPEIIPFLRLNPPKKGYRIKGIKKTVNQGGELGKHESMDSLIIKML